MVRSFWPILAQVHIAAGPPIASANHDTSPAPASAPAPAPAAAAGVGRNLVPEWMNDPVVTFVADNRRTRLYRIKQSPEEFIWDEKSRLSVDYLRPPICAARCTGQLATNELYGVSGAGITRSALFTIPEGENVNIRVKAGSSTSFALGITAALTGGVAIFPGLVMTVAGDQWLAPGLVTLGAGLALLPLGIYLAAKGVTHVTIIEQTSQATRTAAISRPAINPEAKDPSPRDVLLIFPRITSNDTLSKEEGRTLRLALPHTPPAVVNHTPTGRTIGRVRSRDIDIPSSSTYRDLRCGFGREWGTVNEDMPKSYRIPYYCDDIQDPDECREKTTPLVDKALDELRAATANVGGWVASDIQCWTGKNSLGDGRIWCEAMAEGL